MIKLQTNISKRKDDHWQSRGAYIAFTTLLILSAVVLLIGGTLALLAVFQAQQSLAQVKGEMTHSFAEGCMVDALLSSFKNDDYAGGTKTFPEGTCTTTVSKTGNNWVLVSAGTIPSGYTRRISVSILRENGSSMTILSWKETD